ncbi:hypothetical protein B484DRAFT_347895 [Ochromonadaceae sp. CCMP2298]|nr:hypothetical protein B484DRAFT_347895 [Ochromonadaceae sp. CCMP2298]|mmetsp:Transcript_31927/g.68846  ORF Transcript_31927/g.68846 Transcript_31927/m.68846 type:complete len:502 (-) Transcript_31927:140-1645(-)
MQFLLLLALVLQLHLCSSLAPARHAQASRSITMQSSDSPMQTSGVSLWSRVFGKEGSDENSRQRPSMPKPEKKLAAMGALMLIPLLLGGVPSRADDELAKYAAEGNKVAVDGQCFIKKCALETSGCANDPSCLKGLSCLARCKGGSMCSTGCFAKYGSERLDSLLSCSVEKNDCVHVPGKGSAVGWTPDFVADLPAKPLRNFEMASLGGNWYKVMGLDSRYDCFDCQRNFFQKKDADTLKMEALFRIPRPTPPGYLQSRISEELHRGKAVVIPEAQAQELQTKGPAQTPHMQSQGEMFGLTFWENWYVLGESKPTDGPLGISHALAAASWEDGPPELKLIYYTGHTLQGSYKGAFLYSRSREMTPQKMKAAQEVIEAAGLKATDFCVIRNQCFLSEGGVGGLPGSGIASASASGSRSGGSGAEETPFWFLGQNFFQATKSVATELADWFEDPAILSEWLVGQQERMVFQQPLEVSPFASLSGSDGSKDFYQEPRVQNAKHK